MNDLRTAGFWDKVSPPDESGCMLWRGETRYGYGIIRSYIEGKLHRYMAHRISYEMARGEIQPGMVICHRCDNPPCVNPDHLFSGTQADNLTDMRLKGRAASTAGEKSALAKLTNDNVLDIRRLCSIGVKAKEIAAQFGISHWTVYNIKYRTRWSHLPAQEQESAHA